jgi:hypothetical protein
VNISNIQRSAFLQKAQGFFCRKNLLGDVSCARGRTYIYKNFLIPLFILLKDIYQAIKMQTRTGLAE